MLPREQQTQSPQRPLQIDNIYAYPELDSSTRSIRVLELHGGPAEVPLSGALNVVNLDDSPVYDALSYVREDPTPVAIITLNGGYQLPLANSLRRALQGLHQPDVS
ncbi:hypothetical protein GQ53DRAFT_823644 [Thozetella sp. PMI_491]|nr:hypothetical protein GQ53DRAFT_823644 [Thozetella sp. PMI_491]